MNTRKTDFVCNDIIENERLKQLTFVIIYHKGTGYLFYDELLKPEDQRILVDESKKLFSGSCETKIYALPEFVIIKLITNPSFVRLAKRYDEERRDNSENV